MKQGRFGYSRKNPLNKCSVCYENRDIAVQHARKHEARMWGTKERVGISVVRGKQVCLLFDLARQQVDTTEVCKGADYPQVCRGDEKLNVAVDMERSI
jgi:hypothetical protein